jgi:hypothetical protein
VYKIWNETVPHFEQSDLGLWFARVVVLDNFVLSFYTRLIGSTNVMKISRLMHYFYMFSYFQFDALF